MSVSGKYAIGPNITWFFQTSNLKVIVANRNCIFVFNRLACYLTKD